MFKKLFRFLIIVLVFIVLLTNSSFADELETSYEYDMKELVESTSSTIESLEILSNCAIAYDRSSKTTLWGKNESKQVPMASTTKIMTAIILVENIDNLNMEIEVCKEAANIGGSRLGLKTGDKISINDLLYGLMLCSGNDCAIQIAVSASGSVENYAKLMNNKSKELGLKKTNFITPHGLDEPMHYTTAYELAIITDYALNIDKIAQVVNTKTYTVSINGYTKTINNTNELLGYLEGVNGVKTGFTNGAGRCLVTSVNRNGFNIIVVVLGANTKKIRTKDSIKIINYIYDNYEIVDINEKIEEEYKNWIQINEGRIKINKGTKRHIETNLGKISFEKYPIKKEEKQNIRIQTENKSFLEAPITKNEKVGRIEVYVSKEKIQEINIQSKNEIKKNGVWEYLQMFAECLKK